MRLFLTGFMCSGKTTVGRLLAEATGLPLIDLDAYIEEQQGATVPEIFAEFGEEAFRDMESQALIDAVSEMGEGIVSTGGGIVLRSRNRDFMRSSGYVVHLSVNAGDVLSRAGDTSTRPLLHGEDAEGRVGRMLSEREPLYLEAADLVVPPGLTAEAATARILDRMNRAKGRLSNA